MLAWESGYKIGEKDMDAQHLVLFALLNQIDANLGADLAGECIADVVGALEAYIGYHFAHEEALMKSWDYPGLDRHIALHQRFSTDLTRLQIEIGTGQARSSALKLRTFVLEWLLGHIMESDADYARFIAKADKARGA
jgi:hemerythrin-like metal-binding protein